MVSDLRVHVSELVDGVMSSYKAAMTMLIPGEKGLLFHGPGAQESQYQQLAHFLPAAAVRAHSRTFF